MRAATTPFLTAQWRSLLMLNFEADAALLRDRVPAGTELDAWNGRHFISLVGFRFLDTRVMGHAIPLHQEFEEVNLRFYVRRKVEGEWRRGVVFVREIVPRRAIAWVARAVYGENYKRLPMRSEVSVPALGGRGFVQYKWKQRGNWYGMEAGVAGQPVEIAQDSEQAFITEHFWGYVARRGGTVEYQVEHPRWKVWEAIEPNFECDVASLYGADFSSTLNVAPASAFVADGSPVVVHRGFRLDQA